MSSSFIFCYSLSLTFMFVFVQLLSFEVEVLILYFTKTEHRKQLVINVYRKLIKVCLLTHTTNSKKMNTCIVVLKHLNASYLCIEAGISHQHVKTAYSTVFRFNV